MLLLTGAPVPTKGIPNDLHTMLLSRSSILILQPPPCHRLPQSIDLNVKRQEPWPVDLDPKLSKVVGKDPFHLILRHVEIILRHVETPIHHPGSCRIHWSGWGRRQRNNQQCQAASPWGIYRFCANRWGWFDLYRQFQTRLVLCKINKTDISFD